MFRSCEICQISKVLSGDIGAVSSCYDWTPTEWPRGSHDSEKTENKVKLRWNRHICVVLATSLGDQETFAQISKQKRSLVKRFLCQLVATYQRYQRLVSVIK